MKSFYLALITACLCHDALAADIATDIRRATDGPNTNNGGYLEIGVGFEYNDDSRLFISEAENIFSSQLERLNHIVYRRALSLKAETMN